ncbi:MAG: hypothetical protein VR65_23840 [Desulfobulbaceae bacterium BRH_c16a]|nr:MAG: hypothetical protein VR65_23840 [Desulfobulbaceae bacterium BRH_c16a]
MNPMQDFIVRTEAKLMVQQGQIEILMGLLSNKVGKEEFMNYLKFVVKNPGFGKEAKYAATEFLRQDTLWPAEQIEGQKQ